MTFTAHGMRELSMARRLKTFLLYNNNIYKASHGKWPTYLAYKHGRIFISVYCYLFFFYRFFYIHISQYIKREILTMICRICVCDLKRVYMCVGYCFDNCVTVKFSRIYSTIKYHIRVQYRKTRKRLYD